MRCAVREAARVALESLFPSWSCRELESLSELERRLLVEQNLISENFCEAPQGAMFCQSEDGRLSVMVNEEDHFRIQLIEPGLELAKVGTEITQFEFQLESLLEFAYAEPFGYLTSCVSNLGTGLRASVMLHVPALVFRNELEPLLKGTRFQDLTLRGAFGEGSSYDSGFVQISNTQTLGLTEGLYVDYLAQCVELIVEAERQARARYLKEDALDFGLSVFNTLDTLRTTTALCSYEATKHLSRVRLAACCGLLEGLKPQEAHRLLVETRPAHLQIQNGGEATPQQRDKLRAEILNDALAQVSQVSIPTDLHSPFGESAESKKPPEPASSTGPSLKAGGHIDYDLPPEWDEPAKSSSQPPDPTSDQPMNVSSEMLPPEWTVPPKDFSAEDLFGDQVSSDSPFADFQGYLAPQEVLPDFDKLFDEPTEDDLLDVSWLEESGSVSGFPAWVTRFHKTGNISPLYLGMERREFWKVLNLPGEPNFADDTEWVGDYEFGFSLKKYLTLIACHYPNGELRTLIRKD